MDVLEAKRYYTVKEVAARFGVTPGRVRQWICWGELRAEKIGPVRLIPEPEVERFASQQLRRRRTRKRRPPAT